MEPMTNLSNVPDEIIPLILEFLPTSTLAAKWLSLCRRCFCLGMCQKSAFRDPVETWWLSALQTLDEHALQEPPAEDEPGTGSWEAIGLGVMYAEREARCFECVNAHVHALIKLAQENLIVMVEWLADLADAHVLAHRQLEGTLVFGEHYATFLQQESQRSCYLSITIAEIKLRVEAYGVMTRELKARLPDPELPLRWGEWIQLAVEPVDFPIHGDNGRYGIGDFRREFKYQRSIGSKNFLIKVFKQLESLAYLARRMEEAIHRAEMDTDPSIVCIAKPRKMFVQTEDVTPLKHFLPHILTDATCQTATLTTDVLNDVPIAGTISFCGADTSLGHNTIKVQEDLVVEQRLEPMAIQQTDSSDCSKGNSCFDFLTRLTLLPIPRN
eukprot:gnl/MRDRNA2_/MRDRNA2_82956_c0_seq1.p1 gnl/MRDRNA2_/MRDRNA2_82956_c0~~gnl/MRDRNA2_/MRDRNA2_82956_c0_seq1.p1  ORF type:complete len:399 (+),score=52.95 gnl/MRDRNA2_/MRDRNA2_82956_c0_seq1:46-1197(+)